MKGAGFGLLSFFCTFTSSKRSRKNTDTTDSLTTPPIPMSPQKTSVVSESKESVLFLTTL